MFVSTPFPFPHLFLHLSFSLLAKTVCTQFNVTERNDGIWHWFCIATTHKHCNIQHLFFLFQDKLCCCLLLPYFFLTLVVVIFFSFPSLRLFSLALLLSILSFFVALVVISLTYKCITKLHINFCSSPHNSNATPDLSFFQKRILRRKIYLELKSKRTHEAIKREKENGNWLLFCVGSLLLSCQKQGTRNVCCTACNRKIVFEALNINCSEALEQISTAWRQ